MVEPFGGAIEAQRTRSQRVRNDTTLIQCYPAAKLIITVVPYYLFACLYYCLNERKPCERPLAGEEATCRERWTVIDALYFTTASIATVGYGDLYVESGPSRAFTAAWMLVGWSVVLSQVAMVFRGLFEGFGRLMRYLIDKIGVIPILSPDPRDALSLVSTPSSADFRLVPPNPPMDWDGRRVQAAEMHREHALLDQVALAIVLHSFAHPCIREGALQT